MCNMTVFSYYWYIMDEKKRSISRENDGTNFKTCSH